VFSGFGATRCGRGALTSLLAFLVHEIHAERALGDVLIVGAASESHVSNGWRATPSDWIHVIEFQEVTGCAAAPVIAHEGALSAVALPDGPANVSGDVTGVVRRSLDRSARTFGPGELALLEPFNECVERAVEYPS
jgi:hypothetical protein